MGNPEQPIQPMPNWEFFDENNNPVSTELILKTPRFRPHRLLSIMKILSLTFNELRLKQQNGCPPDEYFLTSYDETTLPEILLQSLYEEAESVSNVVRGSVIRNHEYYSDCLGENGENFESFKQGVFRHFQSYFTTPDDAEIILGPMIDMTCLHTAGMRHCHNILKSGFDISLTEKLIEHFQDFGFVENQDYRIFTANIPNIDRKLRFIVTQNGNFRQVIKGLLHPQWYIDQNEDMRVDGKVYKDMLIKN